MPLFQESTDWMYPQRNRMVKQRFLNRNRQVELNTSVTQHDEWASLSQGLQQALRDRWLQVQPLQIRCAIREQSLLVLAEHLLHVEPEPDQTFSNLEAAIRELVPEVLQANLAISQFPPTLPVQILLRIAGYQHPYASHAFRFDLKQPTATVLSSDQARVETQAPEGVLSEEVTTPPPLPAPITDTGSNAVSNTTSVEDRSALASPIKPTTDPWVTPIPLTGHNVIESAEETAETTEAITVEPNLLQADRVEVDLTEFDLEEPNFVKADSVETNFSETDLAEANLPDLTEAGLTEADLAETGLAEANLAEAGLTEADLTEADLAETGLAETGLTEADLAETGLAEADLAEINLTEINLTEAASIETDLVETSTVEAEKTEADLVNSTTIEPDLVEANLSEANPSEAATIQVDALDTDFAADLVKISSVETDSAEPDVVETNPVELSQPATSTIEEQITETEITETEITETEIAETEIAELPDLEISSAIAIDSVPVEITELDALDSPDSNQQNLNQLHSTIEPVLPESNTASEWFSEPSEEVSSADQDEQTDIAAIGLETLDFDQPAAATDEVINPVIAAPEIEAFTTEALETESLEVETVEAEELTVSEDVIDDALSSSEWNRVDNQSQITLLPESTDTDFQNQNIDASSYSLETTEANPPITGQNNGLLSETVSSENEFVEADGILDTNSVESLAVQTDLSKISEDRNSASLTEATNSNAVNLPVDIAEPSTTEIVEATTEIQADNHSDVPFRQRPHVSVEAAPPAISNSVTPASVTSDPIIPDSVTSTSATSDDESYKASRRFKWTASHITLGGAVGSFVLVSGLYLLTRPCVIGGCEPLQRATQLSQEAIQTAETTESALDVVEAYKKLNEASYLLETIPAWSSHHGSAQSLLASYEPQAVVLGQVVEALEQANNAAQKSQNPPHPLQKWREIQWQWREVIARLERIPLDSPLYGLVQRKLQEYQTNLTAINQRVAIEQQAQDRITVARQAGQLAEAQAGAAQSPENWQETAVIWTKAIEQLRQIPQGTIAHDEAQQLLAIYQPKLAEANTRRTQELTAADAYSRALDAAEQARILEQQNQWVQAASRWQDALAYAQRVPIDSAYYSQAQPLIRTYSETLQQAQDNSQRAMAVQSTKSSLERACGGNPKICSYTLSPQIVRVQFTSGYDQTVGKLITNAESTGGSGFPAEAVNQVNGLLRTLAEISDVTQVPIELYDAGGTKLGTYTPSLSGYVAQ